MLRSLVGSEMCIRDSHSIGQSMCCQNICDVSCNLKVASRWQCAKKFLHASLLVFTHVPSLVFKRSVSQLFWRLLLPPPLRLHLGLRLMRPTTALLSGRCDMIFLLSLKIARTLRLAWRTTHRRDIQPDSPAVGAHRCKRFLGLQMLADAKRMDPAVDG